MTDHQTQGTVEKPKDIGAGPAGIVKRWMAEVEIVDKENNKWIKNAKAIRARYRNDKKFLQNGRVAGGVKQRGFNIFYSNMKTVMPAVISKVPKPAVERRHKDRDKIARAASQIMERSLDATLDEQDFKNPIKRAVFDWRTIGRGICRERYIPIAQVINEKDEDGNVVDRTEIIFEKTLTEYVPMDRFKCSLEETWEEKRWVLFEQFFTRSELEEQFGEDIGKNITLDTEPAAMKNLEDTHPVKSILKKAKVWEIWDRTTRKVIWIAPSYKQGPLDEIPDPYNLSDFFPMPEPLLETDTNEGGSPVAPIMQYLDQLEELDFLTQRIHALQKGLRLKGIYPSENKDDIQALMKGSEVLIPVVGWRSFAEKGGLKQMIEWVPLDMVAGTLIQLYDGRDRVKADVQEISGIADIIRGISDPRETAKAQEIKGQFASGRLQDMKDEVAEFVRNIIRIKAEIISELYAPETIRLISGWDYLLADNEPLDEQAGTQPQNIPPMGAPGQAAPPDATPGNGLSLQQGAPTSLAGAAGNPQIMALVRRQEHEKLFGEAIQLLRIDPLRDFRIDIETDSTIAFDQQRERKDRIEFVQAMATFIGQAMSVIPDAPFLAPIIVELMSFAMRSFKIGRPIEETFEVAARTLKQKVKSGELGGKKDDKDPRIAIAQLKDAFDKMELQVMSQFKTRDLDIKEAVATGKAVTDIEKMKSKERKDQGDFQLKGREIDRKTREDNIQLVLGAMDGQARAAAQRNSQ